MSARTIDALLATIRRLPLDERRQLIARATREADEDTPKPPPIREGSAKPLIGLMADEPDIVDRACALAYAARTNSRMRSIDD